MSCSCGSNCDCGSSCSCGERMYAGLTYTEKTTTKATIIGVAPVKTHYEGSVEMSTESGNGCKCGSSCTCDPCNC